MVHSHGWQVDANCWQEHSVPFHMDLPKGLLECLFDTAAGRQNKWPERRIRGGSTFSYDLTLKSHTITSSIFLSHIGLSWYIVRGTIKKDASFRRWGWLGACWSQTTTMDKTEVQKLTEICSLSDRIQWWDRARYKTQEKKKRLGGERD